MENSKKRKRDGGCPRISYHTSTRTFDRLFKENSLVEMKEVARRKLGLDAATSISFAQIREGKTVDLEDDDDFDAFFSLAHSTSSVDVKVVVSEQQGEASTSNIMTPTKKRKRRRNKGETSEPGGGLAVDELETSGLQVASKPLKALHDASIEPPRKKKKRKVDTADTGVENHEDSAPDVHRQSTTLTLALNATHSEHATSNIPETLVQDAEVTTEHQKPRKARKKRKEKEQAEELSTENHATTSLPPTENKVTKQRKNKSLPNISEIPALAKTVLPMASSGTHEWSVESHQHKGDCDKKEKKKNSKKTKADKNSGVTHKMSNPSPEVLISKSQKNLPTAELDGPNVISKKSRMEKFKNLAVDSPKVQADLNDIFHKALTKRTADAVAVNVVPQETKQHESAPASKSKGKRKSTVDETPAAKLQSTNAGSMEGSHHPSIPETARHTSHIHVSKLCPLCLLSPVHERQKCHVVLGGPESLAKRLSDIQKASDDGQFDRFEVMTEIRERLRLAEKKRETLQNNREAHSQSQDPSAVSLKSIDIVSQSTLSEANDRIPTTTTTTKLKGSRDSSDESSSDDTAASHANRAPYAYQDGVISAGVDLANVDLGNIIRGPGVSALRIADLHSPDTSDDDEEDKVQDQVLLEDEPDAPRRSRKHGIPESDSSDEADSCLDDAPSAADEPDDISRDTSRTDESLPPSGTDHISFQAVDRVGESEEVDRSADAAFGAALEQDTAVLDATMSTSSESATGTGVPIVPSLIQIDPQSTLEVTPPAAASILEPPAGSSGILLSISPTAVRDSRCNNRDDAQPADPKPTAKIIQRMKTRSGKTPMNEKILDDTTTPLAPFPQPSQDAPDSAVRRTRPSTRQQTLGTTAPSALPEKLGRKSRLIRPSNGSQMTIDAKISSSTSQNEIRLDTWATLKPSSPIPDVDSTMMVDELEPSSPPHEIHMDLEDPNTNDLQSGAIEDPLFFPMESLPPFPYSQWGGESQKELQDSPDDPNNQNEIPVSSQPKPKPSQNLRYRRLTDITSDHGLFSTPPTTTRATRSSMVAKKTDMYGRSGQDEIESESDSESDNSDAQDKSHIPKLRRAGTRQTRRK